ncbi:MAG: phosphotransferase system enzyme I (PtsI) [Limisphaerales bacterium]|jgi:phosphotransferase system enzyme I (PtsI)
MSESGDNRERIFRGIPASEGVCQAKIIVLRKPDAKIPERSLSKEDIPAEIQRFEAALTQTRTDIREVQAKVSEAMGAQDAGIFEAHLMVLEDRTLIDGTVSIVEQDKINVEQAFQQVIDKYTASLAAIDDAYLRERVSDMRDISSRVLDNLLGRKGGELLDAINEPCIVVCHEMPPSMTVALDEKEVLGIATDIGGKTSHMAIMARSMGIPAVSGLGDISQQIHSGDFALLDGYNGVVAVDPSQQTQFEYGLLIRRKQDLAEQLRELRDKPAKTLDGTRITLSANIEHPSDVEMVREYGAEGVGLFRTEYLFIHRDTLPTEEEQYEAYAAVARGLKPNPVLIRTLDLGGDKFLTQLKVPEEMNPFLGWRAIRFCLEEKEIFSAQLRAILRASAHGDIRMMYPMISGVGEMDEANALVEECKAQLTEEGVEFNQDMEIGAMIEIPSAVMVADDLAKRAKFFSIGTNDLIQYSLAVDRMNERIAHLYQPTHPAILNLIRLTVEAAERNGIWAGVCGEMAHDPALVPLLLGLGIKELSAATPSIPNIKYLIRNLDLNEAKELAAEALKLESSAEILERSTAMARRIAPDLFKNQTEPGT